MIFFFGINALFNFNESEFGIYKNDFNHYQKKGRRRKGKRQRQAVHTENADAVPHRRGEGKESNGYRTHNESAERSPLLIVGIKNYGKTNCRIYSAYSNSCQYSRQHQPFFLLSFFRTVLKKLYIPIIKPSDEQIIIQVEPPPAFWSSHHPMKANSPNVMPSCQPKVR